MGPASLNGLTVGGVKATLLAVSVGTQKVSSDLDNEVSPVSSWSNGRLPCVASSPG